MLQLIASLLIVAVGDPVPFDCRHAHIAGHHPYMTCGDKRFYGQFRGPDLHGRPTVEMRYATTIGTGILAQDTALLQKWAGTYHVLWSHKRLEAWSHWPSPDAAIVYRWTYDSATDWIVVTGTRTVGTTTSIDEGKVVGRRFVLPREVYCFSHRVQRFRRC